MRPAFDAEVAATCIRVLSDIDPTGDVDSVRTALGVLWPYVSDESDGGESGSQGKGASSKATASDDQVGAGGESTAAIKAAAKAAATAHRLAWLWSPPVDTSLRLFKIDFGSSAGAAKRYPVIGALLKHEGRLPLIGCVADVLQWHGVLFRALRNGIRREEAAEMSNAQAVERLPHDQQPEAWGILQRFCDSFNRAFVLVERLFECQVRALPPHSKVPLQDAGPIPGLLSLTRPHFKLRIDSLSLSRLLPTCQANPYLYEDESGATRIDLSGSGGQGEVPMLMTPEVSILFSLPSMIAASAPMA